MSTTSLNRPLSGRALHFQLEAGQVTALIDSELLARSGRTARALVKEGPLRVTLIALGANGRLSEHRADGPIAVHVLSGAVRFRSAEEEWLLGAGDLLSLPAEVPHSVDSVHGGVFVLTVASR